MNRIDQFGLLCCLWTVAPCQSWFCHCSIGKGAWSDVDFWSHPCLLETLVLDPFRLLQFCPVSFTIKGHFWISFDQFCNQLTAAPAIMALCLADMAVLPCFISILFLPPSAGPPSGLSRLFSISPASITLSKAEPRPRGSRGSWGSSSSSSSLSAPKSLELPEVNDPFLN